MPRKRDILKGIFEEEEQTFQTGSTPRASFTITVPKKKKVSATQEAMIKSRLL